MKAKIDLFSISSSTKERVKPTLKSYRKQLLLDINRLRAELNCPFYLISEYQFLGDDESSPALILGTVQGAKWNSFKKELRTKGVSFITGQCSYDLALKKLSFTSEDKYGSFQKRLKTLALRPLRNKIDSFIFDGEVEEVPALDHDNPMDASEQEAHNEVAEMGNEQNLEALFNEVKSLFEKHNKLEAYPAALNQYKSFAPAVLEAQKSKDMDSLMGYLLSMKEIFDDLDAAPTALFEQQFQDFTKEQNEIQDEMAFLISCVEDEESAEEEEEDEEETPEPKEKPLAEKVAKALVKVTAHGNGIKESFEKMIQNDGQTSLNELKAELAKQATAYSEYLLTSNIMQLLDENPYEVQLDLNNIMVPFLQDLAKAQ